MSDRVSQRIIITGPKKSVAKFQKHLSYSDDAFADSLYYKALNPVSPAEFPNHWVSEDKNEVGLGWDLKWVSKKPPLLDFRLKSKYGPPVDVLKLMSSEFPDLDIEVASFLDEQIWGMDLFSEGIHYEADLEEASEAEFVKVMDLVLDDETSTDYREGFINNFRKVREVLLSELEERAKRAQEILDQDEESENSMSPLTITALSAASVAAAAGLIYVAARKP